MKKTAAVWRCAISAFLSFVFLLCPFGTFSATATSEATATSGVSSPLGVLTVCSYDAESGVIRIAGTVNHKVMTETKDCRIALFRVPSWRTAENVIDDSEPLAETAMSIRFEFTVKYGGAEELLSLYAAAIIYPDGSRALIDEPKYPAQAIPTAPPVGFKGVSSDSAAGIAEAGVGCVMIDVYLDRLEDGKHSGYLQTVGGMSFYYDRDYVDNLDRHIRSASVSGASVYLRLLVSPSDTPDGLCYASSVSYGAAYRGVVISDEVSALTVYAYISFLCARYNGGIRGDITGLVLGFCADMPGKYNFCASTGPMYYEIYARSLTVMGVAAAAAGNGVRLIVPVSDTASGGMPSFGDFVRGVGKYISRHTDFDFTLMIDGTHNAYHINDEFFDTPVDSTDTGEGDDRRYGGDTSEADLTASAGISPAVEAAPDTTLAQTPDGVTSEEQTDAPYIPPTPRKTTYEDPYICPDNLGRLTALLDSLHNEYDVVDREYLWCWTPGEDTSGSALSVLYSYNYMALVSAGALSFILHTDSERFSSVSHLVKYIDTDRSDDGTAYALEVLGAASWEELIPGFDLELVGGRRIIDTELSVNTPQYIGSYTVWDFGTGIQGWAAGPGCLTLKSVYDSGVGCLKAVLDNEGGGAYSDICYICDTPEPVKFTNFCGFDISCSDDAGGSLYEVKFVIYGGGMTLEGKTVVKDGERAMLYMDTSALADSGGIDAVRIAARRVSGEGDFSFRTYAVKLFSDKHSDRELAELIEEAKRVAKKDDTGSSDEGMTKRLVTAVLLLAVLAAFGVCTALIMFRYDRQQRSAGGKNTNNK